jgi:guanine deaminase
VTLDSTKMQAALDAAYASIQQGAGGPFGACIVREGEILAVAANQVLAAHDPTAHAEVTAIRQACARLETHLLQGAQIYSTTEPCPMCFAAIHWAQIGRVIYGTGIEDVRRLGFNELTLSNRQMQTLGRSPVQIVPDFMRAECVALLDFWSSLEHRQTY